MVSPEFPPGIPPRSHSALLRPGRSEYWGQVGITQRINGWLSPGSPPVLHSAGSGQALSEVEWAGLGNPLQGRFFYVDSQAAKSQHRHYHPPPRRGRPRFQTPAVFAITPPCLAQTVVPSHFNVQPANVPTRAVQGRRRYARAHRRSRIPTTSRSLATFSGGGSWAEPLWKAAHRRIPAEGVSIGGFAFLLPASSACARSLLVPGTCDLTRRRTDVSDSAAPCAWNDPTIPAP